MPLTFEDVFVVGAGSWGTTIADLLAKRGARVCLWAREPELADRIACDRENVKYLPGVHLSPRLQVARTFADGLDRAELVVYAIPTQSLRHIASKTRPFVLPQAILINLAKGIEAGTGCRGSEILAEEIRNGNPVGAVSGPNIAHEVAREVPSKAVVSCNNYRHLDRLKRAFASPCFRVFENPDLCGTELGGALKNVFAIMVGIGDGLGYGVNTKAAIITRALREMVMIGEIMGGHRDTFYGLSGIGDLMATCLSEHGRNRRLGEMLGRGHTLIEAEAALQGRVAEGLATIDALVSLKRQYSIEMPIVETLHQILYDGLTPREGYLRTWSPGTEREAPHDGETRSCIVARA